MLSLSQAAKTAQKSKNTISKDLKSGKLSGSKNEKGQYEIDLAELHRVYRSPIDTAQNRPIDTARTTNAEPVNAIQNAVLQAKLDAALEANERLEADKLDARAERDDWKAQATKTTALLEDHRGAGESSSEPIKDTRNLWHRIRNTEIK